MISMVAYSWQDVALHYALGAQQNASMSMCVCLVQIPLIIFVLTLVPRLLA